MLWHRWKPYASDFCYIFLTYILHCGVGVALSHCAINAFPNFTFAFHIVICWTVYKP